MVYCSNNQLNSLPNNLPQSLETLYCFDNNLTYLPNLPEKIIHLIYWNNPICNILDNNNSLIKVKENVKMVNNKRHFHYSLQFKKQFKTLSFFSRITPKSATVFR